MESGPNSKQQAALERIQNPTKTIPQPSWLPDGWYAIGVVRQKGLSKGTSHSSTLITKGKVDPYYYSPDGEKQRSYKDVKRFLLKKNTPELLGKKTAQKQKVGQVELKLVEAAEKLDEAGEFEASGEIEDFLCSHYLLDEEIWPSFTT